MSVDGQALPFDELVLARELADAPRLLATIDAVGCVHLASAVQLAMRSELSPITRKVCDVFLQIARSHFEASPEITRMIAAGQDPARDAHRAAALGAACDIYAQMAVGADVLSAALARHEVACTCDGSRECEYCAELRRNCP